MAVPIACTRSSDDLARRRAWLAGFREMATSVERFDQGLLLETELGLTPVP